MQERAWLSLGLLLIVAPRFSLMFPQTKKKNLGRCFGKGASSAPSIINARHTYSIFPKKETQKRPRGKKSVSRRQTSRGGWGWGCCCCCCYRPARRRFFCPCPGSALTESGEKEDFLLQPSFLPPPVFCPLLPSTSLPASLVSHRRSRGGLRRRRRGILRLSQRPTRAHSWIQGGTTVHTFESHMRSCM